MSVAEFEAKMSAMKSDPINFMLFNRSQARFIDALSGSWPESRLADIHYDPPSKDSITLIPFLKPNGLGGSYSMVSIWSALMFGTAHPRLRGYPFGDQFPWVKSARLVAPVASLADEGPIQKAMKELFPAGLWHQSKGTGKSYYCEGRTETGWTWEFITSDQPVLQAAGATRGLIMFSEPPPHPIYSESVTRLRGQGLILVEMTQLDLADWFEEIEESRGLMLDGRKVGGKPRVVWGDLEDACVDHHPEDSDFPGHRPHTAIEADIASWPAEEREARRTGKPLRRSGRILPNWGDANELEDFTPYHQECWNKDRVRIWNVVNPHDRLPWPIIWGATFPNRDMVIFSEWPPFSWRECKSSPVTHPEDMRSIILEAEAAIGKPIWKRVMDPQFGETIKNGFNLFKIMSSKCRACAPTGPVRDSALAQETERMSGSCPHSLQYAKGVAYPGSVNAGHIPLNAAIGDTKNGRRPKLYALVDACPNTCYAVRHYAFKENRDTTKGLSDKPQLINKEVVDVVRYAYLSHLDDYPIDAEPVELYKSKWAGRQNRRT